MPHLAVQYPYEVRAHYPHMKPADVAIWERFIAAHPAAYESVEYDFLVGSLPDFDTQVNAETGGSADDLYRKKIDVVGHTANGVDIIEVKPSAGPSALGQVLAYAHLYQRDERPALPARPVIITDRLRPDMEEIAGKMGVRIVVV